MTSWPPVSWVKLPNRSGWSAKVWGRLTTPMSPPVIESMLSQVMVNGPLDGSD